MLSCHTTLAQIMQQSQAITVKSLASYASSMHDPAFSLAIHHHQLMPYLAFSQAQHQVETLHALLYAFSYPGTREAMLQLCLALFGQEAQIILNEAPALIEIAILLANEHFFFALAEEQTLAQDGFALADFSLDNLTQNPLNFLQQFAPVGVIIRQLTITIQSNEMPSDHQPATLIYTPEGVSSNG